MFIILIYASLIGERVYSSQQQADFKQKNVIITNLKVKSKNRC